jgi:2-amino-4-hydroxy-6-hydroxymethyldihydropteridine diphosphokinase
MVDALPSTSALATLALGANLGNPPQQLRDAINQFKQHPDISHIVASPFIRTPPVGCPEGSPEFWNGVIQFYTTLSPNALLAFCQSLEVATGRDPERVPCANLPRFLDIDLLFYGDVACESPCLTLPHPRLHLREFVLLPLCHIAPDLWHPTLRKTIRQLYEML